MSSLPQNLKQIETGLPWWNYVAMETNRFPQRNGEADPVHILFKAPLQMELTAFITAFKSGSSRNVRTNLKAEVNNVYGKPVFRSLSYFVASVSKGSAQVVRNYIKNQEMNERERRNGRIPLRLTAAAFQTESSATVIGMKLYIKYLSMYLRSEMEYKVSFWARTAGQFLVSFTAFLAVTFLLDRFGTVEGFTYTDVLLCFGIVLLAFSTAECFARGFDRFSRIIGNGEFDRMMVRPRSLVFQVLATNIDFSRLGRFLQAVVVLIYAIRHANIEWNMARVLVLIEMTVCGTILFSALFLCYAGLCFFTTEGLEFVNILTDGGREFGAYPLSIYGKNALRFYTYIIPMACVQYYPLLWLLGRPVPVFYALLPICGALFLIPAYALWRLGLRHYKSTGS